MPFFLLLVALCGPDVHAFQVTDLYFTFINVVLLLCHSCVTSESCLKRDITPTE